MQCSRSFIHKNKSAELSEHIRARETNIPDPNHWQQVSALVRHQFHRNDASIDAIARSLDIAIRALQRKLEGEGLQFRQIVSYVRIGWTKEPLSIETVSGIVLMLGYETANIQFGLGSTDRQHPDAFL